MHGLASSSTVARTALSLRAIEGLRRNLGQNTLVHILRVPLRSHFDRKSEEMEEILARGLHGYEMLLHSATFTLFPIVLEAVTASIVLLHVNGGLYFSVFFTDGDCVCDHSDPLHRGNCHALADSDEGAD